LVMFISVKWRRIQAFSWDQAFAALGLWAFACLCMIPFERTKHLLIALAGLVLCLILPLAGRSTKLQTIKAGHSSLYDGFLFVFPVLLTLVLGLYFIDRGHTWGGDFSEYIAQAQVLATGTDTPERPQVNYPYGTAVFLLPFFKIWGLNLLALKLPMVCCYAAFIIAVSCFYRRRFPAEKAAVPVFLFAVSPALVSYQNNILSDLPFLLIATVSLFCFSEAFAEHNSAGKQCLVAAAAGLCVTWACSIRFQGLVILLTFISVELLLLLKRLCTANALIRTWTKALRAKSVFVHLLFYAAFVLSYILYKRLAPASQGRTDLGFLDDFSVKGLLYNCFFYPFFFNDFFSCYGLCPRPICVAAYLASLPLIVSGIRRKAPEEVICSIFSLGMLTLYILWPGPQDFRFLFPILPFMMMFAVYGSEGLQDTELKTCYARFALFIFCIFFCVMVYLDVRNVRKERNGNYQAFSVPAKEAYAAIQTKTGAEERILFFKPRVLYLATGRISEAYETEAEAFNAQLSRCDCILFYSGQTPAMPLDKAGYELPRGIHLEEAFSNSDFILYRIVRSAENR
ncbi:MAG: glycosyltransferase family 39 protein, partial [Treponema sp.]|nr:glycosyltransferase family 39 protein [Treponema sp.]